MIATPRQEGVGRRLLTELIAAGVAQGHRALSLSVNHENQARDLYTSVGFVDVELRETASTMIHHAEM